MLDHPTHQRLRALKLDGMADAFAKLQHQADAAELGHASQRRDLMEIVEDRYGNGSILLTSQLPVDAWHDVIGEPTFADAILELLVHNAHRLPLDGHLMRKRRT